MSKPIRSIACLIASLLLAAALACGKSTTPSRPQPGAPRLVDPNAPGATPLELTVDFGSTLIGSERRQTVAIANDGPGTVTLTGAQPDDGSEAFQCASSLPRAVGPGELVELDLGFQPTREGRASGTLQLLVANANVEALVFHLSGTGVRGTCAPSSERMDFGQTSIGKSYLRTLTIRNSSTLSLPVTIPPLDGGSGFAYAGGFTAGAHVVPAAGVAAGILEIPIEFAPDRVGEFAASIRLPERVACSAEIALRGTGIARNLDCEPTVHVNLLELCRVDFGFATPSAKAIEPVRFQNRGNRDITLTLGSLSQPPVESAPFAIEAAERTFVIPMGGAAVAIDLSFQPSGLGAYSGTLEFTADDPLTPNGYVELIGIGGGPEIDAHPAALDFGTSGTGMHQTRVITVMNVGSDVPDRTDDNLLLASQEDGVWTERRAELSGPDAADFSVEWPPQGYSSQGLAAGGSAGLTVRFAPLTAGEKQARLTIYSNDRAKPALDVAITGLAADLEPCNFEVMPAALDFGLVEPGSFLTLSLAIANRDPDPTHVCIVSLLELVPATSEAQMFALGNGPLTNATINGGGTLIVPVRFQPTTSGSFTGEVRFSISSPTRPRVSIPLTGTADAACLLIAPRELDFGTIGVLCASRPRIFTMYNTCAASLTVTSIELQSGMTGGFAFTKKPALPATLAGGQSSDFGVIYRPIDSGDDTGAVTLTSGGVRSVVSLSARGAVDPVQTDVFASSPTTPVDMLIVVDDSSSMSDLQTSLARNFASFIHYAVQQKVDYHIAVTTTDVSASGAAGRMLPLTGSGTRVITPTTPDKEQLFRTLVEVGTNGSESESLIRPAYLALTSPLLTSHNTGFYRDAAKLNVTVVSDAADQDPLATPVSFYEAFFLGLKGIRRRNDFTFSGIIPTLINSPAETCTFDTADAGQDPRVKMMIQRTGGLLDEICNPDWSKTLEKLGTRVFGLRTGFFLSNEPDMSVQPEPIVITIDGQRFPQYGDKGDKRWDYNSASNAIEFDPLAVPDPGSTMTISYHVKCL